MVRAGGQGLWSGLVFSVGCWGCWLGLVIRVRG